MMKHFKYTWIGLMILLCLPGIASASDWQLGKDENGVRVYSRDQADGSIEVKAETTLDIPLISVMALILDYEAATRWRAEMIKSMKVKEHPNERTWILQVHAEPPWPLPANDSVIEAVLEAMPGKAIYRYKERADLQPAGTKSALGAMNGEWTLVPVNAQRTSVTNTMMMKPNIPVPSWLIKRMVYTTPYEQLIKMGEVAKEPPYQPNAVSPKLKELLAPALKVTLTNDKGMDVT